jgi:hypothetical protein
MTGPPEDAPLLSIKQGVLYLMLGFSFSWLLAAALPFLPSNTNTIVESYSTLLHESATTIRDTIINSAGILQTTMPLRRRLQKVENDEMVSTTANIPRVQFIFTMGLFGDGKLHEFLGQVVSKSPAMKRLVDLGIAPNKLVELHRLLYQTTTKTSESGELQMPGLWNAHCDVGTTKANAAGLHKQVVALLTEIQDIVTDAYTTGKAVMENPSDPRSHVIPIPINTVLMTDLLDDDDNDVDGDSSAAAAAQKTIENNFGYATYPTQFSTQSCHRLDFASLDLWYSTCQDAKVDCRHLFAHRPPLFELNKAFTRLIALHQKKEGSEGEPFLYHLAVIHHYNTMLHIITDEMVQFAPRNIGCLDTSAQNWKDLWLELWGFPSSSQQGGDDDHSTTLFLDDLLLAGDDDQDGENKEGLLLFPQYDIPRKNLETVLPNTTAPYVDSFLQLHNNAATTCIETLQQVRTFLKDKEEEMERKRARM